MLWMGSMGPRALHDAHVKRYHLHIRRKLNQLIPKWAKRTHARTHTHT
jgi:hypothetical protein